MKILSLDTAMAACSAAVVDTGRGVLAAAFQPMERGHAEALAPMVAEVVAAAGLGFRDIGRIVVTRGPGTFTGVRIGLSFARGLGLALGIPVAGIDSLSAIACNETSAAPLLVVSDARNGEVYAASYDAAKTLTTPPHVTTVAAAAGSLPGGGLIIGTGASLVIAASGRADLLRSTAGDLPMAAHFGARATAEDPATMPTPLYLRSPDAKPQAAVLRRMGDLNFEPAGAAAAPLLARLHGEAFEDGWSEQAFSALLGTPGSEASIALALGEPVGFVLSRRAADEAEIITIGTRPGLQRRGVAQQLLAHHVAALAAQGVRRLFLEVAVSNAAARSLYSGAGFIEAGRRKNYYRRPDGYEDALVLRRDLQP